MSKNRIGLIHNLARAGGTLLGKCIGCMENIVLLSEIHPVGRKYINPAQQATEWFGLFEPGELPPDLDLVETIQRIHDRCVERGLTLVIRDWAHWDFVGMPVNDMPGFRHELNLALQDNFHLKECSIVRHPVDQWISINSLDIIAGQLKLAPFMKGYRAYAENCFESNFFKYEDMTATPEKLLRYCCETLGIPFDPTFRDKWFDYHKISGDTSDGSRGAGLKEIRPMRRKPVDPATLLNFEQNPDYRPSIEMLGYE